MNKYKDSFDQLLNEQKEEIVDSKIISCPFDGKFCGCQKDWNCKIPVYLGRSHNVIVDWVTCPRNKKVNIFW